MKIVRTDNFARDNVSEIVVHSGLSPEQGRAKLEELRARCTNEGSDWYILKEDDYVPYVWEP